jgi:RHS repeat-associated protein
VVRRRIGDVILKARFPWSGCKSGDVSIPAPHHLLLAPDSGELSTVTGALSGGYVAGMTYRADGRITQRALGAPNLRLNRTYGYDAFGRVNNLTASWQGSVIQNDTIGYDAGSNVTSVAEAAGPNAGQQQCYTYTRNNRLRFAWTLTAPVCNTGTTDNLGLNPYFNYYSYDLVDGTLNGIYDSVTQFADQYMGDGAHPHAVTNAGANTYSYDANGSNVGRTVGGVTSTLAWTVENRLSSVTTGTSVTSFRYDAAGQRVVRTAPSDKTVYLDGLLEIRKQGATAMKVKRFYKSGSTLVAFQEGTGILQWVLGDGQGTTSLDVPNVAGTATITRQRYRPFGVRRGGDTITATDHGFLGQIEDATGLDYLNARYLDPVLGRFMSVDPLVGATGEAYRYAGNNPITFSDPSGLCKTNESGICQSGEGSSPVWGAIGLSDDQLKSAWTDYGSSPGNNSANPGGRNVCVGALACSTAVQYFNRTNDRSGAFDIAANYCGANAAAQTCDRFNSYESPVLTMVAFTDLLRGLSGAGRSSTGAPGNVAKDLATARAHLGTIDDALAFGPNRAMLNSIEGAVATGRQLSAAERAFLNHELLEANYVAGGMEQSLAHVKVLQTIPVGSNYSPAVLVQFSEWFSQAYFDFWGMVKP